MDQHLRMLMETWLRLETCSCNPCDVQRFYKFVFAASQSESSRISEDEYNEIIESYRDHNANLTDEYLARYNFNQFESYRDFCKFILSQRN